MKTPTTMNKYILLFPIVHQIEDNVLVTKTSDIQCTTRLPVQFIEIIKNNVSITIGSPNKCIIEPAKQTWNFARLCADMGIRFNIVGFKRVKLDICHHLMLFEACPLQICKEQKTHFIFCGGKIDKSDKTFQIHESYR